MSTAWNELLSRWCTDGPVRTSLDGLAVTLPGLAPVTVTAREHSADEVELAAEWLLPWQANDPAASLFPADQLASACAGTRSGLLTCTADGGHIHVSMPLYLDGLSRQSFVEAAAEIARAIDFLRTTASDITRRAPELAEAERVMAESQHAIAEARARQATPEPIAAERTADAGNATQVNPPPADLHGWTWKPTHTVPATGMDAWDRPDGAALPVARLDPDLPVDVTEQHTDDWARITCSNGWTGWVNGRLLNRLSP